MEDWNESGLFLPAEKKELRLCGAVAIIFVFLVDFLLFGGFYLGFTVAAGLRVIAATIYLLRSGCRLTFYSGALLVIVGILMATGTLGRFLTVLN